MSLSSLAHLPAPVLELATLDAATQDAAPQEELEESVQPPGGTSDVKPPAPFGGMFGGMAIPMIAIFAIFYFVMIGPERKARKKREAMLAAMKKGDAVITASGLHGTIAAMADDVVTLQVDEGVRLRFSRAAIQSIASKDA